MSKNARTTRSNKQTHRERQNLINKNRATINRNKSRGARFAQHFQWSRIKSYWFSRRGLITFFKLCGVGLVAIIIFIGVVSVELKKDIPAIKTLYGKNLGGSIRYYDRTGKILLWTDYNAVDRTPVSGSQMSPYIRNATVAIEDKNFYHEGPIDVGGILRSAFHDVFDRGNQLEGASTITQQLVKLNEGWLGAITIWRKIKEVFLAYDMSKTYSKATILTGYLNIAPYGSVDYGIEAASEDYFHIPPSQLSLAQSAMLAAIPQSPEYYSPRSPDFSKTALLSRMDYILTLMNQQGYISKSQEIAAKKVNVLSEVQPALGLYSNIKAPYFVLLAKQQLLKQFGANTANEGGWKVITTLNWPQEQEAEKLVASNYQNVKGDGGNEEATVTENVPTGQVTALVGGVNFYNPSDGQVNYANIQINPGSTFKIYDYTTLIDEHNNVGAGSVLYDVQEPLPGYPCTNKALPLQGGNCLYDYDFQYPGPITIRYAFAGSRNVPAVKAWLINTGAKTIAMAQKMGLTSGYHCYANTARTIPEKCYGSAAIGEGGYLRLDQTVNGFATDARLGNYVPQTFILKVISDTGKTIYQWKQPPTDQVVRPDAAYIIDNILSDPAATYLPGSCSATNCTPEIPDFGFKFQHTNGWDVAIKTGTTHDDDTGLMMGMTTQYAVGSWVGYQTTTKPLIPHFGGLEGLTEPLTRGMITYLTANQKPDNWTPPPGIKTLPAYVVNHPPAQVLGYYYGWEYPSPSEDIYPSWYVPPKNEGGEETIDRVSGDLATACTPPLARETIYNNNASIFSIDIFYNAGAVDTSGKTDPIHKCGDQPPTVNVVQDSCDDQTQKCTFTVSANKGTYALSGGSYTAKPAGTISLLDNGKTIATVNIPTNQASSYSTTISASVANGDQITAEAVDSVLYSATSSAVTVSGLSTPTPTTPQSTTGPVTPTTPTTP